MAAYENFAEVYDELMDDVPYGQWAEFIHHKIKEYHIENNLTLELGCGTGKMMEKMAEKGYDMIGVDSSPEMLEIAREGSEALPWSFLYLLQDMTEFELYGTVGTILSVCDSLNYILTEEELGRVFALVNNYLDPEGIFIFDFNTEHKYRDVIGNTVIAEDREDVSFIWYNDYEEEEHCNVIDLSIFVRQADGMYQKYEEEHVQRGYRLEEIQKLIEGSGLIFLAAYDGYTDKPATEDSERIVVIAREHGKKKVSCEIT